MSEEKNDQRERYEERKRSKIERYRELKAKHEASAEDRYSAFRAIGDRIPMGQPILVGHHSERGHRADLKRMDGHMRKLGDHLKTAKHYEKKIETLTSSRVIFSDDPDALEKLDAKADRIQAYIDEMKRINKEYRHTKNLAAIEMSEPMRKAAENNMRIWQRGGPFPAYCITNARARMKSALKRAAQVSNAESFEPFKVSTASGEIIEVILDEGRIQVAFPWKPNEATRHKLKTSPIALKWSRYSQAWVRKYTGQGEFYFSELRKVLIGAMPEE